MQHATSAPAIRRAAALLLHWSRHDLLAFTECLADIDTKDEALDALVAAVFLSSTDLGKLPGIIMTAAFDEAT